MIRSCIKAAVVSIAITTVAFASDSTSDPQIVSHQINDRIHVLYGGNGLGSNVGVIVTEEGLILMDAMRDRSAEKLTKALAEISARPVSHVFNTHRHEDHISGNGGFVDAGATLVRQSSAPNGDEPKQIRFDEKLDMEIGGVRVEAYAIASHTPDDALIFLPEENVMFLGDTFTTNWHPTFYFAGEAGQIAVIEKALELADERTVVVPGHGRASDKEGLAAYRDAFRLWLARTRELSAAGMTADQMAADAGLQAISKQFLQDGSREEIRASSYRRFIDRTISTELMPIDEGVLESLANYAGDYEYEDGMPLRIVLKNGVLHVYEDGRFSGKIVPLSRTKFHYPGRLDGEGHLTFQFGDNEKPIGATYVGESQSWPARRKGN